jgi:hypothetical protein
MMGAAAFQTYLAKGQLELDRLDREMAVTAANYETLRQERAELRSPGRLTAVAAERGMQPATKTSFIAISPEVLVLVRQATGALDPTFDDEAELLAQPEIRQAAVFGEGRPWLSAVLVPAPDAAPAMAAAVGRVNATLPDYARIGGWVVARSPFTPADGRLTANGRLRREAILARHAAGLDALYEGSPMETHDALP